jgi:Icc-related predicted phosphoesterase
MKITAISDTHGLHRNLTLDGGDVLIHAGDISKRGMKLEILDFLEWFDEQPYPIKIFTPGNHDFYFEYFPEEYKQMIPKSVICLIDSEYVLEGVKFWGSPVTPWFYDWAFNRQRGPEIDVHWQMIPDDTDVLITHGPPMGILDQTTRKHHVGCEDLMNKIKIVNPSYHVFGHIHEAFGQVIHHETNFINASNVDINYKLVNPSIVFEI